MLSVPRPGQPGHQGLCTGSTVPPLPVLTLPQQDTPLGCFLLLSFQEFSKVAGNGMGMQFEKGKCHGCVTSGTEIDFTATRSSPESWGRPQLGGRALKTRIAIQQLRAPRRLAGPWAPRQRGAFPVEVELTGDAPKGSREADLQELRRWNRYKKRSQLHLGSFPSAPESRRDIPQLHLLSRIS